MNIRSSGISTASFLPEENMHFLYLLLGLNLVISAIILIYGICIKNSKFSIRAIINIIGTIIGWQLIITHERFVMQTLQIMLYIYLVFFEFVLAFIAGCNIWEYAKSKKRTSLYTATISTALALLCLLLF